MTTRRRSGVREDLLLQGPAASDAPTPQTRRDDDGRAAGIRPPAGPGLGRFLVLWCRCSSSAGDESVPGSSRPRGRRRRPDAGQRHRHRDGASTGPRARRRDEIEIDRRPAAGLARAAARRGRRLDVPKCRSSHADMEPASATSRDTR